MKKQKQKNKPEDIQPENLLDWARKNYFEYGMAVLEDRAIPDYRDGQFPVTRRILYSAYKMGLNHKAKFVKSARVVGDTIGKFHPHGDSALYGAMVGLANGNSKVPLIKGEGNWGTQVDPAAAAMRYTEMRLTEFSDAVLFNKFYTPVMDQDLVPNYDGSFDEPLILPSLLPVVLLNGKLGIAPGAKAEIPIFETKSVMNLMHKLYSGTELNDKLMYKTLEFTTIYGGKEVEPKTKEAKSLRMDVFRKIGGKVTIRSTTKWDENARTLTITAFADIGSIVTKTGKNTEKDKKEKKGLLDKILDIEGVSEVYDDTGKDSKYAVVKVILKKGLNPKLQTNILRHIRRKLLTRSKNYVLNFTERYTDKETGQGKAKMKPMPLTTMMFDWLKWRVKLERRACAYWIEECDRRIRILELKMIAVDFRKFIMQSLDDRKATQEELNKRLSRKANITVEEADFIYNLKIRQLRLLERKALEDEKKTEMKERKTLEGRKEKPLPYMLKQLDEFPMPKDN